MKCPDFAWGDFNAFRTLILSMNVLEEDPNEQQYFFRTLQFVCVVPFIMLQKAI